MTRARARYALVPPLLALATGLLFLGSKSFTNDEAVSITLARLSWHRFGSLIVHRETNGSLYFTLQHLLTGGSGNEWVARLLSLTAFVGATAIFFLLVRRLFSSRTALVAGCLFALNPLYVEYGQTAREYLLALLLVVSSTYLFVRAVETPSVGWWVAYAVVSALAAYAFLLAATVPFAHALSLAALPRREVAWRRAAFGFGLFLALLIPLAVLLTQTKASGGVAWASGNLPGRVAVSIRDHTPRAVLLLMLLLVTAALAFAWWKLAERFHEWPLTLLVAWLLVPAYLVTVAGLVWQPLFIVRYFMIFAPPLLVFVALALERLPRPAAVATAAVILVVLGLALARWYRSSTGANFRAASAYVAASARPDDGALFYAPYVRMPFELYFQRTAAARSGSVTPVYPGDAWTRSPARFIEAVPMPTGEIEQAARKYRRIWLVLSQYRLYGQSDPGYDHVIAALDKSGFRPVQKRSFAGLVIRRYER